MTTGTAHYASDDFTIEFSAYMDTCDYGVSGSPVWHEPKDVEVESLEILGVEVPFDKLPKDLQLARRPRKILLTGCCLLISTETSASWVRSLPRLGERSLVAFLFAFRRAVSSLRLW